MTTLKNVKEIVLKGKNIRDVDTTPITMPSPVYENGEIKKDSETGEIIYNPSLNTLKTDTLLTETSLPIAYSLEGKTLDPSSQDFKNEIMTLSAAAELKTTVKEEPLQILPDNKYKFGDSEAEDFGDNQNKDALSVGIFKNTLTSGIEFSKEHNSEISDNFMTEKIFKDKYVYSKLHFNENNLSDVDLTDTTTQYIKSLITYLQPSTDSNIIIDNEEFTIYTNNDNNDNTTINIFIDGMKIQIIDSNTNTSRFTINNNDASNKRCILATYSTMTDSKYCQTNNVNNTYNVPENIFDATLLENGLYEGVWDKSTAPKPFKINYGVVNNERVFKAIVEDKNIIDVYTHFDKNNEIVYHKLVLYSSLNNSSKAEHIIYKYNFEKYDSSKTYAEYTETLNGPDEMNSNITFRNLQIKYTYASQPEIVDASEIPSELLPEVKHKLLTTEALKDAYVNSLDLKNNEWYDENKDKLLTVEAISNLETETEKEHLQIANVDGVNKYQFGNDDLKSFDSSETSTKPLTVNVLADTKTTPFEFSKTETFGNNLITEKVLEDTYINDSLKFSKTLTTLDENTEIEDTTIDPEIEHKLITTDALNETYINDSLKFSKTLTTLDENTEIIDSTTSELQTIDPEIEHKLITTDALNKTYISDKLIFGNTLTTNFVKTEESDEKYVDLIDVKEFSKNDKYNNERYFDNNDYYIFNNDYHSPAMEQLVNDAENVLLINEIDTLYSYIHRTLNNTPDKIEYKIENNNDYIYVYGSLFVNYRYDVARHILQERIYQSGTYIYNDISISSDNYYYKKSSNEDTYILVYFNFENSILKFKYCVSYPDYVNIDSNKSFVYSISNVDKTFIPIYDFEFTFIDNELVKIKRKLLFTAYEIATQTITTVQYKNISLIDPEIRHKLLTTDALHDAYVNEIKLLDGMWYDENKHKLITVEASKDLIPDTEHDELQIFPNNEYQFGKNKIEKFNSASTSTNPLSVNVLSNTRTTNFNFDQSQEFKDNLMTEKALKDTYINDTLKFSNNLTTSDLNLNSQEIEECESTTNYNYNYGFYSEYDFSDIKFDVNNVDNTECDNVNIIVDDTKFNLNLQNNGNEIASIILDSDSNSNKMFRFINPQNNNLICLFTYDIINNKFYTYTNNIYDLSNKIEHTPTLDDDNYYNTYTDEPSYNEWKIKAKAGELILYHYEIEIFKICYSISESDFSKFDYSIKYHTKLFNVDKYFTISKQLLIKSKINVNKITANPLIITEPEYPEYKIMEIINIKYNINENKYKVETNYDIDNKKLKTIDSGIEHKLITTDALNEAYVPSKILFNENYESISPLVKPTSKDDFTKYLVTYYTTSSNDTKYYSITSSLESGQNKYYNLNSNEIPEYVYKFEVKNLKNTPPDRCIIFVSTNTPEFVYCNVDGNCSCPMLEISENEIGINEYVGKCWKSTFERSFNILMGTDGMSINVHITRDETGILTDVSITENIYHNNISSNIFNEYNAKYDITSPTETHIIGVVNSENVKVEENKLLTTQNLKNAYLNDKLLFGDKLKSIQHLNNKDEKIASDISSKLITTDALADAYVNSLDLENEEWMNKNKYKLLTVESVNDNNFKSFDKSLLFKKDNLTISENADLSKVNFEIAGKSVKPENLTNAYVSDKLIFSDELGIPFADGKTHKIINYTVKNISGKYNKCSYYSSEATEPTVFKLPLHYSTDSESDLTFSNLSFKVNEGSIIFEVRPYKSNVYMIHYFKENNEYKLRLRIDKWANNLLFDYNLTTSECTYKLNNTAQTLTETIQDNKRIYEHEYTLDSKNTIDSFEIENLNTKTIKFSYAINNYKIGEFIVYFEDENYLNPFKVFIDYYCYLDLNLSKYIEYTETINLIGREIYDPLNHDKYIQDISLNYLHSPDNNLFRFSVNQGIKTYNQNQVADESLMKDVDYNFEVEHKLLTTDTLNDAYVNSLEMNNNEWFDENKYKLVTVEAMKDVEVEGIKDKLLFAKTLTTNPDNTEIEDKTIDPEIEDKLIKTDALDNAYTKNKLTFVKNNLTNIDLIDTETKYVKSILSVDSDHTNNLQIINSSTLETIKNYGLDLVESNRTLSIKSGTFRIQYLPNHGETRYIFNVRATSSQGYQALIMIGDNENRNKYVQTNNPNNSWTFPDRIYDSVLLDNGFYEAVWTFNENNNFKVIYGTNNEKGYEFYKAINISNGNEVPYIDLYVYENYYDIILYYTENSELKPVKFKLNGINYEKYDSTQSYTYKEINSCNDYILPNLKYYNASLKYTYSPDDLKTSSEIPPELLPEVKYKLLTSEALKDAYVNELKTKDNKWFDENKHKLVTVEAMKDVEGIEDKLLFAKTLTTNPDNTDLEKDVGLDSEDIKIDSEIEDKLLLTNTLADAYVSDPIKFGITLTDDYRNTEKQKTTIKYNKYYNILVKYLDMNAYNQIITSDAGGNIVSTKYYIMKHNYDNDYYHLDELYYHLQSNALKCAETIRLTKDNKIKFEGYFENPDVPYNSFTFDLTNNTALRGNNDITESLEEIENGYKYMSGRVMYQVLRYITKTKNNIYNVVQFNKIQHEIRNTGVNALTNEVKCYFDIITNKLMRIDEKLGLYDFHYEENENHYDINNRYIFDDTEIYNTTKDYSITNYISDDKSIITKIVGEDLINLEYYDINDTSVSNPSKNKRNNSMIKIYSLDSIADEIINIDDEIKHKLVTTDALKDTYVNELKMNDDKWKNENKYKLITVEAMKDVKADGIKDKLLFAKTLTTNPDNTEIEDKTIDPEIEDKLITTNALKDAYVSDKLIFDENRFDNKMFYKVESNNVNVKCIDYTDNSIIYSNIEFSFTENDDSSDTSGNKKSLIINDNSSNYSANIGDKLDYIVDCITTINEDDSFNIKIIRNSEYLCTIGRSNQNDDGVLTIIDSNPNHTFRIDDNRYIVMVKNDNESFNLLQIYYNGDRYMEFLFNPDDIENISSDYMKFKKIGNMEYSIKMTPISFTPYNYFEHNDYLNVKLLDYQKVEIKGQDLEESIGNDRTFDYEDLNYCQIVASPVHRIKYISEIDLQKENILDKLITTNSLRDAYVNELKLENNDWVNENKYKLITVNALKNLKITGEGVNVDDMILYNKYYCELTNNEAETLSSNLYSTEFTAKVKNNKLLIYFDDILVNKFNDISNYINIDCTYKSGSVLNSYNVIDKYYGFIFDVYEMNNLFDFNVQIDSDNSQYFENISVIQRFAILRNGEQTNERILDKACILKYCEISFNDVSLPSKKIYIIKYSNDEADEYVPKVNNYTIKGSELIIGDNLLINSGDTLKITNNYESEIYSYDENEYSIDIQTDSVIIITFTKL